MEMNQKTEDASGIRNWFLSSFHRRTNVGELHLNRSDGNTIKDRAKSVRRVEKQMCLLAP